MLKIILTVLCLLGYIISFSQEEMIEISLDKETEENIVYNNYTLKNQANFIGGKENLLDFYKKNSKYEVSDTEIHDKTIYFILTIGENGGIYKLQILSYPNKKYKNELKRLIKLMPKWKPAKKDGINVKALLVERLTMSVHVKNKIKN